MRIAPIFILALLPICVACSMGNASGTSSSSAAGATCRAGTQSMARLELLFGTERAEGPPVGEAEWTAFLDKEVAPRFPDGLTVLAGYGQWRGRAGTVAKEQSRVLLLWYRPGAESEANIEAIRSAYKRRFGQESVLRADGASCVSF